jgi:hypothetical protein
MRIVVAGQIDSLLQGVLAANGESPQMIAGGVGGDSSDPGSKRSWVTQSG